MSPFNVDFTWHVMKCNCKLRQMFRALCVCVCVWEWVSGTTLRDQPTDRPTDRALKLPSLSGCGCGCGCCHQTRTAKRCQTPLLTGFIVMKRAQNRNDACSTLRQSDKRCTAK